MKPIRPLLNAHVRYIPADLVPTRAGS